MVSISATATSSRSAGRPALYRFIRTRTKQCARRRSSRVLSNRRGLQVSYAIIGSGNIGSAVARQFARSGLTVSVATARGPQAVAPLVEELGPSIHPAELSEA